MERIISIERKGPLSLWELVFFFDATQRHTVGIIHKGNTKEDNNGYVVLK
jgi:hypothetical protein